MKVIQAFLIWLIFYSQGVWAISIDPGQEFRNKKQLEEYKKRFEYQEPLEADDIQKIRKHDSPDASFVLKKLMIEGANAIDEEIIREAVAQFVGKSVDFEDLKIIRKMINKIYLGRGYILAKVNIPPQSIVNGVVKIVIFEGKLDSAESGLVIRSSSSGVRLKEDRVKKTIRQTVGDNAVRQVDLERGLLLLSSIPGVQASGSLDPGSSLGTARMVVNLNEAAMFNGWVRTDNFGSRLTGKNEIVAGITLNDMDGSGNQFSFIGSTTSGSGQANFAQFSYVQPVGFEGLDVGVGYRYMDFEIGKEFSNLNVSGNVNDVSVFSDFPLVRSRKMDLLLHSKIEWKGLRADALGYEWTNQNIATETLGADLAFYDQILGGGYSVFSAELVHGNLNLIKGFVDDQQTHGPHADGDFTKLNLSLMRNQQMNEDFYLAGRLHGQFASKNLASSEKIQLGGQGGVRAYSYVASGDQGAVLNLEIHRKIALVPQLSADAFVFYDLAWAQQWKNVSELNLAQPNSFTLQGLGAGLSVGKSGKYALNIIGTTKLGSNPIADKVTGNDADGSHYHSKLDFTLQYFF